MSHSSDSSTSTVVPDPFAKVVSTTYPINKVLTQIRCLRHAVDDDAYNLFSEDTSLYLSADNEVSKQNLVRSIERLFGLVKSFHSAPQTGHMNTISGGKSQTPFEPMTKADFESAQRAGKLPGMSWERLKTDLHRAMEAEPPSMLDQAQLESILRDKVKSENFSTDFVDSVKSYEARRRQLKEEGMVEDDILGVPHFTSVLSELCTLRSWLADLDRLGIAGSVRKSFGLE
jgi:hypothetical protein